MRETDLYRPLFNSDVIANALNDGGSQPLLRMLDGPTLSVTEIRGLISQFIQAFESLGVRAGSRVSLIAPNRPECLFVTHALQMLAAVYVPLHPLSSLADHLRVIEDADVEILVFDAEAFETRAVAIVEAKPGLRLLAIGDSEYAADIRDLSETFPATMIQAPRVEPDEIMRLGYSGGTTGKPKAIPTGQRVSAYTGMAMQAVWEWPSPPHILSCAPLTHAGAAMFMPAVLRGGTFLVLPRFDPLQVLQSIEDYRINCIMLVPTMIYALLDHPRFEEFDLSSLETVFYGASAMSPVRLREAIERIGPVFAQFYGQSEAPMVISYMRKGDHDVTNLQRLASCGRPSPWIRLQLQDADGNIVADGEPGEICVQGPLVMDGYRDEALNTEVFKGGWLHTGDVAIRDPDGFLRIVDRTKDMIISGGFNIYPREIENVIAQDPSVAEVAIIGVPHATWGEAVMAVIVPKPGASVIDRRIMEIVAVAKGSYQSPKVIALVDSLPQTPVGKPDKKALRARYANAFH